jgi:hypothetical protein
MKNRTCSSTTTETQWRRRWLTTLVSVDGCKLFILGKDWERATRYGGRDKAISSQSLASISFSVL